MGIQSDIENLVGIMKVWNIFPEGMFIGNFIHPNKLQFNRTGTVRPSFPIITNRTCVTCTKWHRPCGSMMHVQRVTW